MCLKCMELKNLRKQFNEDEKEIEWDRLNWKIWYESRIHLIFVTVTTFRSITIKSIQSAFQKRTNETLSVYAMCWWSKTWKLLLFYYLVKALWWPRHAFPLRWESHKGPQPHVHSFVRSFRPTRVRTVIEKVHKFMFQSWLADCIWCSVFSSAVRLSLRHFFISRSGQLMQFIVWFAHTRINNLCCSDTNFYSSSSMPQPHLDLGEWKNSKVFERAWKIFNVCVPIRFSFGVSRLFLLTLWSLPLNN